MDFIDPETIASQPEDPNKPIVIDDKTNELVEEFENKVDSIYQNLETNTKLGWSSMNGFFNNIQSKLPDYYSNLEKTVNEKVTQTKDTLTTTINTNPKLSQYNQELSKTINKENSEKLLKNISSKTTEYLDDLDQDLEKIENLSLEYANKLGGFLKKQTGVASKSIWGIINENSTGLFNNKDTNNANGVGLNSGPDVLFNIPAGLSSNRVEAQLHELQTNKELYQTPSDEILKLVSGFKITDAQIKERQTVFDNKESQFYKLFIELTTKSETPEAENKDSDKKASSASASAGPAVVLEDTFWGIYFVSKDKIIEQERKRQELLKQNTETNEDDEEFDWDDDEEDDEKPKEETPAATGAAKSPVTSDEPETPDKKDSDLSKDEDEEWE